MKVAFVPAEPSEAARLAELRHRVWETTYRGIYPDEMIDHFVRNKAFFSLFSPATRIILEL